MVETDGEQWEYYKKLVVKQLDDLVKDVEHLSVRINENDKAISSLLARASVYGVLSGTLASLAMALIKLFEK